MISKPAHGTPAVPSRNALRVLRRLALAGSTVGSFCTVAAITYDVHRRVRVAERIVENKRALQTSAPNYDATSAARRLSRMMEAAEAGEFMGLESWKEEERKFRNAQTLHAESELQGRSDEPCPTIQHDKPEISGTVELFAPVARSQLATTLDSKPIIPTMSGRNNRQAIQTHPLDTSSRLVGEQTASILDVRTANLNGRGFQDEESSLPQQMQDLLDRDRPIDAAQIFLDTHPASIRGISSDRRELAVQTFYVNCKQDNVFIARNVFERLEEVDKVSPTMWKILIFALAKKGCIESVATLYTRYMHKFQVPPDIVDIVLRCLIESHRLTTAKWFLLRNLQLDRDCGLCGAYLTGLWRKTRSIELLNGQLKKLLTILPRLKKNPTDKLFNPVIKAYVEFGRLADAEALVDEMTTTYEIPLRCRTKGLLVYGKALSCDWEGVDDGLQEMHELGLTAKRRDFTPIFDRIFLEYWVSHTGVEIRHFVFHYIDRFNIVPDKVLYKHILEALVEKGDEDMIAEFTNIARERLWKTGINDHEFLELLRGRRLALEDSPVGFWQMLQAAREEYGRAATSQHILGYDQRSFPLASVNQMPKTQNALPWYQRTLQGMTPSKPVDQYQKLHKQMTHYMHVGKMTEALKCFQNAKNAKFQMKQLHVELAVIATLLEQGLSAARALIDAEWRGIRHLMRFFPIFFRQITEVDPAAEGEIIKNAVLRFYELCWTNKKMVVKHHIIIATSRKLIARNKPELAIDVLATVYMSRYRRVLAFDGVCMKMFIRAFAAVDNIAGIRWCILTALSRGSALSRDFVVEVRRILGVLHRDYTSNPPAKSGQAKKAEQLDYLEYAADLLEKKCEGDPKLWELKGNTTVKKTHRRMLKRPLDERRLYKQSGIQNTIEGWDEEYELEAVLGRIEINPKSILAQWNEPQCMGQKQAVEELP